MSNHSTEFEVDGAPGLFVRSLDGSPNLVLTNLKGHHSAPESPADRAGGWLRVSMLTLAALSAVAACVSYAAQYRLIEHVKTDHIVAALQAGIPDAAALVFATLGIALALHGRRAFRARVLNLAAVATSVAMNVLASQAGWRDLAVWAMPPVAYALCSDALIAVLRTHTLARRPTSGDGAEMTPMQFLGRSLLYSLRLFLAPPSTLSGLRRALLAATPLPAAVTQPGAITAPAETAAELPAPAPRKPRAVKSVEARKPKAKAPSKKDVLIQLAKDDHGLAELPLDQVSKLATKLAGEVDMHPATARRILLGHARSLKDGGAE